MSVELKCAICGRMIDQDKDIIFLQKNLFCDDDFEQYVFCKDCYNKFFIKKISLMNTIARELGED